MSVTLLLSVVALVAGQPYPMTLPPPVTQQGSCQFIGWDMQCCLPDLAGCAVVPGMPINPWMPPPPPPPQFLQQVCCASGTTCCPVDFIANANRPQYKCCTSEQTCSITSNKGTCVAANSSITNGMTPGNNAGNRLDGAGRCPTDGSRPFEVAPGVPAGCNLNILIPNRQICPIGMKCVKDKQANTNTGVCCLDSHCGDRHTCADCVTRNTTIPPPTNNGVPPAQQVCSWLSQGDAYNPAPRCVQTCDNFPDKSCIPPDLVLECPYNATTGQGRNYNTGSCVRRCGYVGTGRSSRITNDGLLPPTPSGINKTACCTSYGGDFCCDDWGALARHCSVGYVPNGPQCGVPIRGTPNNYYNSPPGYPPAQYQNPNLPGYGQQGYQQPWGPQPYYQPPQQQWYQPFWPQPQFPYYREMAKGLEGEELKTASDEFKSLEDEKWYYYTPQPQFYQPWGAPRWSPFQRPVYPAAPTVPLDQLPSPYICSCDSECGTFNDCCQNYADQCIVSLAPTVAPTAAPSS